MNQALQRELALLCRDGLKTQAMLAPYTTFGIGGPADYLAIITGLDELKAALQLLHQQHTPFLLLGGGSNVLISDAGLPGLTIINRCKSIHWPRLTAPIAEIQVAAGVSLAGLARKSLHHGLAGLSWAVSIPGSVGGAIVGNAGAHGHEIADVLHAVQVWHAGQIARWPAAEMAFSYRSSRLKQQPGPIILSATLHLRPDTNHRAQALADAALQQRRRSQPTGKSAGSIFKNPPGDYAGRLIEQVGLKGHCAGDACISTKHANFIINRGHATATQVMTLIRLAQEQVQARFGILLEPEIRFLGQHPS